MSDHYSMPRIPRTLDNGIAQDWLEYTDEQWGLVHMGDVVDIYPDTLDGDKSSGEIRGVEYGASGELSMLFLENKKKETQWLNCPTDAQWVDYPGAVYHHKEDANE